MSKPHFKLHITYERDDIVGMTWPVWYVSRALNEQMSVRTAYYSTARTAIAALGVAGMCDTNWP